MWTNQPFNYPKSYTSRSIHKHRDKNNNQLYSHGHLKGQCVVFVSPYSLLPNAWKQQNPEYFRLVRFCNSAPCNVFRFGICTACFFHFLQRLGFRTKRRLFEGPLVKGGHLHGPMASENRCDYVGVFWMNDWWYWWVMVHDDDSWWW